MSGLISVRTVPGARRVAVTPETAPDGTPRFRVEVTAAAEGGKANKAVLSALAAHLGVPKSALSIARGETSRDKLVRLETA